MKKENTKPAEAKKTTKKVSKPKGSKSTKKIEPTSNVIDFDSLSSQCGIEEDIKEAMEIERLKEELAKKDEELAKAKEALAKAQEEYVEQVDKICSRANRRERAYDKCIYVLMAECDFLMDEMPWWKKRSKKFCERSLKYKDDFIQTYTAGGGVYTILHALLDNC